MQIVLQQPGPCVDPSLNLKVEYESDVEQMMHDKLIFKANVELLSPGTLTCYELKAQLISEMYE